jgi:hypothetical protein
VFIKTAFKTPLFRLFLLFYFVFSFILNNCLLNIDRQNRSSIIQLFFILRQQARLIFIFLLTLLLNNRLNTITLLSYILNNKRNDRSNNRHSILNGNALNCRRTDSLALLSNNSLFNSLFLAFFLFYLIFFLFFWQRIHNFKLCLFITTFITKPLANKSKHIKLHFIRGGYNLHYYIYYILSEFIEINS